MLIIYHIAIYWKVITTAPQYMKILPYIVAARWKHIYDHLTSNALEHFKNGEYIKFSIIVSIISNKITIIWKYKKITTYLLRSNTKYKNLIKNSLLNDTS